MQAEYAAAEYATTGYVKSTLYAYAQFGYDTTLANKLGYGKFNDWVKEVLTHVQTHYLHGSLGTKIKFQVFSGKIMKILNFHHLMKIFF